jgi:hypothetical protein
MAIIWAFRNRGDNIPEQAVVDRSFSPEVHFLHAHLTLVALVWAVVEYPGGLCRGTVRPILLA